MIRYYGVTQVFFPQFSKVGTFPTYLQKSGKFGKSGKILGIAWHTAWVGWTISHFLFFEKVGNFPTCLPKKWEIIFKKWEKTPQKLGKKNVVSRYTVLRSKPKRKLQVASSLARIAVAWIAWLSLQLLSLLSLDIPGYPCRHRYLS